MFGRWSTAAFAANKTDARNSVRPVRSKARIAGRFEFSSPIGFKHVAAPETGARQGRWRDCGRACEPRGAQADPP
jgi:hypothetical protein